MGIKTVQFCDCCGATEDQTIKQCETIYHDSFDGHKNIKRRVEIDLCENCYSMVESIVDKVLIEPAGSSESAARAAVYVAVHMGALRIKGWERLA